MCSDGRNEQILVILHLDLEKNPNHTGEERNVGTEFNFQKYIGDLNHQPNGEGLAGPPWDLTSSELRSTKFELVNSPDKPQKRALFEETIPRSVQIKVRQISGKGGGNEHSIQKYCSPAAT